jgi:hypothetical protein
MREQILDGGIIIVANSILKEQNCFGQGCFFQHRTFVLVQVFGEGESSVASFMTLVCCGKSFTDSLQNKLSVLAYPIIFA